jgi:hypothetical protein
MQPDVALTLVIPLRAKAGMSLPDFYQYWLNAHVTLPRASPASAASGFTSSRSTTSAGLGCLE